MSARDRILGAVRAALSERAPTGHPGEFGSWGRTVAPDPVDLFCELFESAGGTAVRLGSLQEAREWMAGFAAGLHAASVGETVPSALRPELPHAPPEDAPLGVSFARLGVAETGSVLLDAGDGQRTQLLPPVHLIWLPASGVRATLAAALAELDLGAGPSALGLHSGPSKSADIGRILVEGVHGPGSVAVGLLGFDL